MSNCHRPTLEQLCCQIQALKEQIEELDPGSGSVNQGDIDALTALINTAQTTANTALSLSATANTTSGTALTTASTAQSNVSVALTTAQTAEATAVQAINGVQAALALIEQGGSGFLHKNTMAEMRAITNAEVTAILDGTYIGVMLHGYYAYGDTPAAIVYYKSSTSSADDQGSIVVINSSLKLEHKFSVCNVAYYGLQAEINTVSVVDRNTLVINNAIKIAPKVIITQPGKYWCRANRGGEGGSYFRYEGDPGGTTWWQVGDGNGQPGGINMLSNRTLEMGDGVTLKMRGTFMDAYNFITIWNKENVTIRGGSIIGDYDIDPDLNEHKRPDGTNDGGQWGYGISLQGAKNVLIENVNISKMWADGINLSPDYLHNYVVNSDIVVRNTKSHHNRRQGMSIDGGSKLSFYTCTFADTKGTDPQCGVDMERDTNNNLVQLRDVLFFDCKFLNNQVGARTAFKEGDKISVKFDSCLFYGNVNWDYDSYVSNGVFFTNCKFTYQENRIFSIELSGTQNHVFNKCEIGNSVRSHIRSIESGNYKSKDIIFDDCTNLAITLNSSIDIFFSLSDTINFKINNCNFQSTSLQASKRLVFANDVENLEILNNTVREIGWVFEVKNTKGFRFNNNVVINSLSTTGYLETNVKYFELCDNNISGNSYFNPTALSPAFWLYGTGNSYGKITGNTIYKDNIFTPLGAISGEGKGLYREYISVTDNIVIAYNKLFGFTNDNGFQFNGSSTNLSVTYLNQEADITYKGIVKQSAAIGALTTPDGTDAGTTQTLVNAIKAKLNTLISDQKTAGQIVP